MLAARDQENLVHGHQAAAAAKPLNQGARQLLPKTPGNKAPKTPFKVPLNDENGIFGNGAGAKTAFGINGKGNENLTTGTKAGGLGGKNAFVTPIGPRARAPLGLKTNNAKTKVFQTPGQVPNDVKPDKTIEKSAIARKAKPRAPHAEMAKLEVLDDQKPLEEREIEYMPPPAKNLPNLPDDMPHEINLSMFENGGLMRGYGDYFSNLPDEEGLSYVQRKLKHEQDISDKVEKRYDAIILRDIESMPIPCMHFPECPGDECKDNVETRKKAEEKYQKTMASIELKPTPIQKKTVSTTKGAPTIASRKATTALSQPKPTSAASQQTAKASALKSKLPSSLVTSRKKTPPPTNPSPMRHTAATAASKTTMGYSKGRATSATLRKTVIPPKSDKRAVGPEIPDITLAPATYIQRYGIPPFGSDIWIRCRDTGCFDEDDGWEESWNRRNSKDLFIEEAEQEFELTLS